MSGGALGARQRSVHCPAKAQAFIRARAGAAGKTVSGYVLDLVRADDPGRSRLAASEDERRALLEGVRGVDATLRALCGPLPQCGGLTLIEAVALLAEARPR